MTAEAAKVADRELKRLKKMSPAQAEYQVTRNYLENLAEIPWSTVTEDQLGVATLSRARKQLDDDHYGLEKVKKRAEKLKEGTTKYAVRLNLNVPYDRNLKSHLSIQDLVEETQTLVVEKETEIQRLHRQLDKANRRIDSLQASLVREQEKKLKGAGAKADQTSDFEKNNYIPLGTCGAVVVDSYGTVCTATSTGGLTNKVAGRIGDTPTIGAGFWAEEWYGEETSAAQMVCERGSHAIEVGARTLQLSRCHGVVEEV